MKTAIAEEQFARITAIANAMDQKFISRRVLLKSFADGLEAYKPANDVALQAFVSQHSALKAFFDNISIVDMRGELTANFNSTSAIGRLNLSDREYFRDTVRTGKGVISQPLRNRANGLPQVIMTEPVFDQAGRMVSLITAQINLNEPNFLGELADVKFGKTGYMFITNTEGIVISSPRKSRILKHTDDEGGSNPVTARSLAGFEGTAEGVNRVGVHGLYAFKQLSQTNWIMGAIYPRDEAFAQIETIEQIVWVGLALLATLVGIVSLLLTQRQLLPLALLHQHMLASVGKGTYQPMLERASPDEIGDLQRTFEQLMVQYGEAERRLAENRDHLRSILAHAGDAFVSLDAEGRVTEWNHQAELIFGWKREEVLSKLVDQFIIPPAMRERHAQGMQSFQGTGLGPLVDARVEIEALHRTGRTFPIEISVGALRAGDHFVANAFIRDISERREAAERIAAGERFVRGIADNVPALVSYIDRDEKYTFANAHIMRRHPGETLVGRTVEAVRGPNIYGLIGPWIRRALAGESVTFINPGSEAVGTADLVYEVSYIPDRATDGTVNGFYSLSIDITERKRAEEALLASEKRFRSVTDNMPALVSYLDTDERFAFANAAFKDWFGTNPEEMIGKTLREVVGDVVYEPRAPMLARAYAGERVEFDTHRVVDGVPRDVHSIYVPDLGGDGVCQGVFALSLNITSLKNIERELAAQARVDTLTLLPNRLALNEALPKSIARAKRTGSPLALMFLDVDHFKSINDTFGHAVGDQVLVEFARRLRDGVRVTDTVARLAGDEFVVLLESPLDEAAAAQVAQKIVALVGDPLFSFKSLEIRVTTSVGVAFHASFDRDEPGLGEHLMQRADLALYRAKAAGRNGFVLVNTKEQES
ncbi:diguanylate cyclase domain-containing protein [Acidovorax sp. LjRoot117]|uniref:sensor domain-containing diguanylate cyclase n=1 Tax=Acidovorax sp. LjRoot117 TaxID=3342255 RepID=UPI003ED14691